MVIPTSLLIDNVFALSRNAVEKTKELYVKRRLTVNGGLATATKVMPLSAKQVRSTD